MNDEVLIIPPPSPYLSSPVILDYLSDIEEATVFIVQSGNETSYLPVGGIDVSKATLHPGSVGAAHFESGSLDTATCVPDAASLEPDCLDVATLEPDCLDAATLEPDCLDVATGCSIQIERFSFKEL